MGFHERFVEALRRRLYPNGKLHLKQLADAIGRSESSVTRWWRGEARILAEDLARIARHFADRGDHAFLGEIFPEAVFGRAVVEADRTELMRLLRSMLATLPDADDAARETHFWITSEGGVVPAPLGHIEYAARALDLPVGAGNLVRYATSMLGWIAVTVRADGIVCVRHDGRRVASYAIEALCEWLELRRAVTPAVVRSINIDGNWLDARHDSVDLAVAAFQRVAVIVRKPRRPWKVKRLPLDSITDERLKLLLKIHREAPDQVIHTAASVGAFVDSNIFSVDGENATALFCAPRFLISRQAVEGRNIMSIPDTDYAMMVRARLLRTVQEGPIYWELAGTLNNEYLHYYNLAIPEPGTPAKVLTTTVVIEHAIID